MSVSLTMPMEAMTKFLVDLLEIPSPTGYHAEAIAFTGRAFDELNIPNLEIQETRKGALMITWRGSRQDVYAPVSRPPVRHIRSDVLADAR